MTKTIDTLVEDIYSVVKDKGGWDATINEYFLSRIGKTMMERLNPAEKEYKPSLRMSNLGKPCERQLYYDVNSEVAEDLPASTYMKFLYGDILEDFLLTLAVASGHTVEGEQDEQEILGIKGHRDAVIDGVSVDVKSASSYSFKKFETNSLRENDPFGYIQQLSSYVYASKDDPIVVDKTGGAFLVIDKTLGKVCLDYYDFTEELEVKEDFVKNRKDMVNSSTLPDRGFAPVPHQKSGNMKLPVNCSYCPHKFKCYEGLRSFIGSYGPLYLTKVVKEPYMKETTND